MYKHCINCKHGIFVTCLLFYVGMTLERMISDLFFRLETTSKTLNSTISQHDTLAYDHFYFGGSRSKRQYLVEIQYYVYGLIIWRKILHAFTNILKIPGTPLATTVLLLGVYPVTWEENVIF